MSPSHNAIVFNCAFISFSTLNIFRVLEDNMPSTDLLRALGKVEEIKLGENHRPKLTGTKLTIV